MRTRLVGVAAASIVAVQIMALFLPPLYEVRDRKHGSIDTDDFRHTAYLGALLAFGLGALIAVASRTPAPIVSSLIAVGVVVGIYEWALRNPVGA